MEQPEARSYNDWQDIAGILWHAISTGLRLVVHFSDASQASYPLELGAYTIGSDKGCTIRLADDPQIEDIHAILTITHDEIVLEDFAAPSSLQLTGAPVERKRSLTVGDEVILGSYRLSLIELSAPHNSATCDLSPNNRAEVDKLWSQLQRGLPGYDDLLELLRNVISPQEAEMARGATFSGLRALVAAADVLVLLAVTSALLPPGYTRLSALLYDLAGAWAVASALILVNRFQVNFAGRVLLPLLYTLRFLEPPSSDWYQIPHAGYALEVLIAVVLLGVLVDFGASSEPRRRYLDLRRLALLLVGAVILYDKGFYSFTLPPALPAWSGTGGPDLGWNNGGA
ncbi:MAG: FHA domain-containing protein [Thermoanaerobaculia bacterium]